VLSIVDILIIAGYLLLTLTAGSLFSKILKKGDADYYLGGNTLPWYMLGLSNASGMFDISGTMWLVTLTFVYGLKSIWIPWLWPVFNQIFLMVFLSAWLRRSNVTTGAEWIRTRFGQGPGADLSHMIVVVFALLSGLGFLAYGFIGLGKFMEIFIPWETVSAFIPFHVAAESVPHLYGIVFTLFAVFYTVLGGMKGIVFMDIIQYTLMTLSSLAIAVIAFNAVGRYGLTVPEGWLDPLFGLHLNLDWSSYIPGVSRKIAEDGYELFGALFMMMLFKGVLVSFAGPAPNYDMQKILSARSPSDAAKMSGFVSIVLMPVRYLMISGFAALGIIHYEKLDLIVAGKIDFEQVLPSAMSEFLPAGLLGLLLAGLLAAFMSTFSGTLNAAQAYIHNDIYKKFFLKGHSGSGSPLAQYLIGLLVVAVSVFLGLQLKNVNQILQLLVSALWGGYTASNVLKWYWWRFNGQGYFWGMIAGIVTAALPMLFQDLLPTLFPGLAPDIRILYYFPVILIASSAGSVAASLLTAPTPSAVLCDFYRQVKPWGFWGPIREAVLQQDPSFRVNSSFKRDMMNVALGIIWQTSLVALPMFLIFHRFQSAALCLLLAVYLSLVLKRTWWNRLGEFDQVDS